MAYRRIVSASWSTRRMSPWIMGSSSTTRMRGARRNVPRRARRVRGASRHVTTAERGDADRSSGAGATGLVPKAEEDIQSKNGGAVERV